MKRMIFPVLALICAGCTDNSYEAAMVAGSDVEAVVSEAEFVPGTSDSTAVIKVTTNRSWSAHLNDFDNPIDESDPLQSIGWAVLSEESHPNLTHVTETTDLVVTFRRNYARTPRHGVVHIYLEGGAVLAVDLTQKGAVYHLRPSVVSTVASDDGELIPITIDCNTAWEVRIKDGATAEAVLKTVEGFDPAIIYLRVKENDEKVDKKVSLVFSATDCRDTTITITQPATTSDLKLFEVFTRLDTLGGSPYQQPVVRLDTARTVDSTAAAVPFVTYRYTTGRDGFDAMDIPTTESPEFPSDGLKVIPDSPHEYDPLYVIILGTCEGYRNSYTRVVVRNWKFGKKYTYETSNGITIDTDPDEVSNDYIRYKLDKTKTEVKMTASSTFKGNGYIFYKVHNQSATQYALFTQFELKVGEETVDGRNFEANEYIWNDPGAFVTPKFTFSEEDGFTAAIHTWGLGIWDIAILEQQKYKP